MKKSLLALAALSAFATAAQAQSTVTVYGVVDVSYGTLESKATTGVVTKTTSAGQDGVLSGTRLGFKGTEDLGGGNSAIFQIELGLNATEGGLTTANSGSTNRNSFVGLQSKGMGTLKAGRMPTLNKNINDSTVFGGSTLGAGWVTQVNGGTISNERQSNMVEYTTPTFSGLSAAVQMVKDKSDVSNVDNSTKVDGMYLGLNYTAGALDLRYANKNVKAGAEATTGLQDDVAGYAALTLYNPVILNSTSAPTASTNTGTDAIAERKVKQDSILASYNFGVAKIVATHNATKQTTVGTAGTLKKEDTTLGVSAPMGKFTLLAQYGEGDSKPANGGAKTKIDGFQVGALYSLSKRTTAYALYGEHESKVDNAATATEVDAFAVGLRHSF
jgi:predicted porin